MTNNTKFDECLALQIEKKFGIMAEKDIRTEYNLNDHNNSISGVIPNLKQTSEIIISRASSKRRKRSCKISKIPKLLHKVCCSKGKCNKWSKS